MMHTIIYINGSGLEEGRRLNTNCKCSVVEVRRDGFAARIIRNDNQMPRRNATRLG